MTMSNLRSETLSEMERYNLKSSDVLYVSDGEASCTFDRFLEISNFEYNSGYGSEIINDTLIIVGKDWWMERREYDGSEWWEFKKYPENKPEEGKILLKKKGRRK